MAGGGLLAGAKLSINLRMCFLCSAQNVTNTMTIWTAVVNIEMSIFEHDCGQQNEMIININLALCYDEARIKTASRGNFL